ncbi:MAG TPA: hypothetical protein VHJ20_16885 [Polyangia bacterium]|nr:hypothetical protein [Polyangia bacterium]
MGEVNGWKDNVEIGMREGKRLVLPLAALFATVAVLTLVVGLLLPKRWDAQTTIVIDTSTPLDSTRVSGPAITEHTTLVTQVMGERKVLRELLAFGGFVKGKVSPQDQLILQNKLKQRIKIEVVKDTTIKISYYDSDPQRAARMTNKIAEIFIRESRSMRTRATREAFEFIDGRVKEYGDKLTEAHGKLLAYYHGQAAPTLAPTPTPTPPAPGATPPTPAPAGAPAKEASAKNAAEITSLRAEEASLSDQLARAKGAAPTPAPAESKQAEDQYRARVLSSQAELDRLLGTYTDEHPDVRRARHELETAKEELHRAEQARLDLEKAKAAASALDDEVTRETRARLEAVQARLTALTGQRPRRPVSTVRPVTAAAAAAIEANDPEMKGVGHDTVQSELIRRYEATRDIYQDMLKKRETARVAMDLDAEQRGFAMRVEEEAEVPVTASSLRLAHISLIGLVLGALAPLGVLFGIVRLDPRVRSPWQIERLANVPLLVSIPRPEPKKTRSRFWTQERLAGLLVATVFVIYALVLVIRMKLT